MSSCRNILYSNKHELCSVASPLGAGQVEETGKILVYLMTGLQSENILVISFNAKQPGKLSPRQHTEHSNLFPT